MNAEDRYRADVEHPSRWLALPLGAIAVVCGVLGQNVFTYGRRRATITDRTTAQVVGQFAERAIVSEQSEFGFMLTALHTRTAEEFERFWLASNHNELTAARRCRGRLPQRIDALRQRVPTRVRR